MSLSEFVYILMSCFGTNISMTIPNVENDLSTMRTYLMLMYVWVVLTGVGPWLVCAMLVRLAVEIVVGDERAECGTGDHRCENGNGTDGPEEIAEEPTADEC